jgi:hypothetical protein
VLTAFGRPEHGDHRWGGRQPAQRPGSAVTLDADGRRSGDRLSALLLEVERSAIDEEAPL